MERTKVYSRIVRRIRERAGLSQEQLAREMGLSWSTVNRWENEKSVPSHLALMELERFCEDNNLGIKVWDD